jgi:hypothetical protein
MPRKKTKPAPRRKRAATSTPTSSRYAWGVAAIAAEIGRSAHATDWMIRSGAIKSAHKVGDRWVADIEQLHRELRGETAR